MMKTLQIPQVSYSSAVLSWTGKTDCSLFFYSSLLRISRPVTCIRLAKNLDSDWANGSFIFQAVIDFWLMSCPFSNTLLSSFNLTCSLSVAKGSGLTHSTHLIAHTLLFSQIYTFRWEQQWLWSLPDAGTGDPQAFSSPVEGPEEIQLNFRHPSMYIDVFSFFLSNPTAMGVLGNGHSPSWMPAENFWPLLGLTSVSIGSCWDTVGVPPLSDTIGRVPEHQGIGTGTGKTGPVGSPSCGSALGPSLSRAAAGFTVEEKTGENVLS